jgi:hypothetical protein
MLLWTYQLWLIIFFGAEREISSARAPRSCAFQISAIFLGFSQLGRSQILFPCARVRNISGHEPIAPIRVWACPLEAFLFRSSSQNMKPVCDRDVMNLSSLLRVLLANLRNCGPTAVQSHMYEALMARERKSWPCMTNLCTRNILLLDVFHKHGLRWLSSVSISLTCAKAI